MSSSVQIDPTPLSTKNSVGTRFLESLRYSLRYHRALLITCGLTWCLARGLTLYFGKDMGLGTQAYLSIIFIDILPVLGGFAFAVSTFKLLIFEKPESPVKALFEKYKALCRDMPRITNLIVVLAAMIVGFSGFSELKPLIYLIQPYRWDVAFMEIDRILHFGHDPWVLLSPIFGSSAATRTINFIYNIWFYVIFVFWLTAAWSKPDVKELSNMNSVSWSRQFTLAFMLSWIIGGFFLAILWSSMGPAFYDLVDPSNNPFAAQMGLLGAMDAVSPIWALETQNLLRESYLHPGSGGPEGISAMPSVHNITATLFVFAGYKINKYLGHLMSLFMICILIGSVHLGWHYAIDGYVGILIGWACWWGAGRILKRR